MWNRINTDTVHLLYLAIGGFLCLFMLLSASIKERLYFGEANIAIIVGAILGPFAAKAVNPTIWSNFDLVVLEFSRFVLIVQCFAVALEMPKYYVEKHWKSLFWLVGPAVVWGWMVCSLLVWFMVPHLSFRQSMTIASCFNAVDPVLAATVVGKGRFAKRIPKHTRDLLLAESASNGFTTSISLGLSILLTRFPGTANQMARSLFLYTILYQILLAGLVGFIIGFVARGALKYAEKHDSTDRESFLVFSLMVALFCAGLGSLIGIDDVLLAFCAGYAFSRDGWFRRKTEESHVSNAINLLLNLTYFVFLGSIIPWPTFNETELNISAWRLVTGTLLIFSFRRIPVILLLKPLIPDVKTWRGSLFYGHFGPIGVGAIFSAALISSEPGRTGIAGNLLRPSPNDAMQLSLWPVVTFVVFCSSIFHGSSVPIFVLFRKLNTVTITMSYTTGNEEDPTWLNRLPRIPPTSTHSTANSDAADIAAIEDLSSWLERNAHERELNTGGNIGSTSPDKAGSINLVGGELAPPPKSKTEPAKAYQFGNTIIVEDEDGDIVKKYQIPPNTSRPEQIPSIPESSKRVRTWFGFGTRTQPQADEETPPDENQHDDDDDDNRIRFTIGDSNKRLTKEAFLREIQKLDNRNQEGASYPQAESSRKAEARQTGQGTAGDYRYEPETEVEKRRRLAAVGASGHSDTSDINSDIAGEEHLSGSGAHDVPDSVDTSTSSSPQHGKRKSSIKPRVPEVIITPAEEQIASCSTNEEDENQQQSDSEMLPEGGSTKGKGKRVSFELE